MTDNDVKFQDNTAEANEEVKEEVKEIDVLEAVKKVVEKANLCYLTTIRGKQLVSRPMYLLGQEFSGELYLLTKTDSPKLEDIKKDSRVSLAIHDKVFVSLSGRAEIQENLLKKKTLWTKGAKDFFECSYDDPSIALVCITVDTAHYWENTGKLNSLLSKVTPLSDSAHEAIEL